MRLRFTAFLVFVIGYAALQGQPAVADLVTNFDPPAYTSGSIVGQNGWTDNDPTVNNLFTISRSNPSSTPQALAVTDGYVMPGGYQPELFSPGTATGSASTVTSFKIDFTGVNPPTTEGAVHTAFLVSKTSDVDPLYGYTNRFVGGFNFQPDGRILVEEYSSGFGGIMTLMDTGVAWTPSTYHTCTISVNAISHELIYTYDGKQLADTTAFYEQAVGNFVLTEDTESAPGEVESIDDLSITAAPEPASFGLLGIAAYGLMFIRRRASVA